MEKILNLKWVILFLIVLLIGGFLSTYADWTVGMFQGTWNLISGLIILSGLGGLIWSALKLNKK